LRPQEYNPGQNVTPDTPVWPDIAAYTVFKRIGRRPQPAQAIMLASNHRVV
jgi:hypothetical protein